MDIIITKGGKQDRIEARRSDGSVSSFPFPHKGPIPHDVVHFIVESALGLHRGFWGMVAAGRDPEDIGAMSKLAGHASAKRAVVPDPEFVEIIQVERLVEAFEADQWGGGSDNDAVRAMATSGCAQSCVAPIAVSNEQADAIRRDLHLFLERWRTANGGESLVLHWAVPVSA